MLLKAANSRLCNQCETQRKQSQIQRTQLPSPTPAHPPPPLSLSATSSTSFNIHNDMRHSNTSSLPARLSLCSCDSDENAMWQRCKLYVCVCVSVWHATPFERPYPRARKYLYRMAQRVKARVNLTCGCRLTFFLQRFLLGIWYILPNLPLRASRPVAVRQHRDLNRTHTICCNFNGPVATSAICATCDSVDGIKTT